MGEGNIANIYLMAINFLRDALLRLLLGRRRWSHRQDARPFAAAFGEADLFGRVLGGAEKGKVHDR